MMQLLMEQFESGVVAASAVKVTSLTLPKSSSTYIALGIHAS